MPKQERYVQVWFRAGLRFNYIPKNQADFVAQIGIFLVLGVVISIMAVSMYMYAETSSSIVEINSPDKVAVGPVEYTVSFEEIHQGDEETKPENMFVQILITAENTGDEKAMITKEQFYIIKDNKRYNAVYGEFSSKDLQTEWLEPGKSIEKTTQFDIPFDDEMQYKVVLRPNSEQLGANTAIICIAQC